jgi:hypothetical protein
MHHHLDALLGQAAQLVERAERIQEGGSPRISAAGRIGGLGNPHRLSGRELVAKIAVEGERLVGPGEPLFGERRIRTRLRHAGRSRASLRGRPIVMVGKCVDVVTHLPKHVTCRDHALRPDTKVSSVGGLW